MTDTEITVDGSGVVVEPMTEEEIARLERSDEEWSRCASGFDAHTVRRLLATVRVLEARGAPMVASDPWTWEGKVDGRHICVEVDGDHVKILAEGGEPLGAEWSEAAIAAALVVAVNFIKTGGMPPPSGRGDDEVPDQIEGLSSFLGMGGSANAPTPR